MSRSSISPLNAVACSQKVSWRPQAVTAMHPAAHASPSWACHPRPTSKKTERARRERTKAAQTAVKRLRAKGSQAEGRKRNGYRTEQVNGWRNSDCQVQPDTREIAPIFEREA